MPCIQFLEKEPEARRTGLAFSKATAWSCAGALISMIYAVGVLVEFPTDFDESGSWSTIYVSDYTSG